MRLLHDGRRNLSLVILRIGVMQKEFPAFLSLFLVQPYEVFGKHVDFIPANMAILPVA